MKRTFKQFSVRSLSVILSLALLLVSLPLSVIAMQFVGDTDGTDTSAQSRIGIVEMTDMRTESAKYFRLEDGSYALAQYNTAVHYLDENGDWQDIDNTLTASSSEIATSDAKIKFTKKTPGNGEIFAMHDGNRKIALSLVGAAKKVNGEITNYSTEHAADTTKLQKMMTLDKISASVKYADILPGVDLEYIINGKNIKENIIVKEAQSAYTYSFTLSLNNLIATAQADGSILISDSASGDAVYQIPAPVMWDANGVVSDDATMTLTDNGNGKYTLTITADSTWMNAEGRAFPVTIDPPLYTPSSSQDGISIAFSSTDSTSGALNASMLRVDDTWRAYLKVGLPNIPSSAYIIDARLAAEGDFLGDASNKYVAVYDVLSDWNEMLTWGDVFDSDNPSATPATDYTDYAQPNSDDRYSWNITPIVKKWYNGENYGLMIAPATGTTFGGARLMLYSFGDATVSVRPSVTIQYRDMKGIEDYWSFSSHGAGFAGSGAVNNATGNLTFSIPTLTTTDALMPITPSLIYNQSIAGLAYTNENTNAVYNSAVAANGFKLNIQESVGWTYYGYNQSGALAGAYVWADGDGTEHYFVNSNEDGTYSDEDGLLLTLSEQADVLTITDSNKNVRTFAQYGVTHAQFERSWHLSSITDKNGNQLSFTFDSEKRPTSVVMTPDGSEPIEQLRFAYDDNGHLAVVWNPTSGEGVIFRYSDSTNGSTTPNQGNYLRYVIRAHGVNTETEWMAYYDSGYISSRNNVTVDGYAIYTYGASGKLTYVTNSLTLYRLAYAYDGAARVARVREYAMPTSGSVKGQEITFTYKTSSTEIRTSGTDDVHGNDDDLRNIYVFDSAGRTISAYTTDVNRTILYGASSGEYVGDANEKAKNNLKSQTQTVQHSSNYLINGGFETLSGGQTAYWTTSGSAVLATINAEVSDTACVDVYDPGDIDIYAGKNVISISGASGSISQSAELAAGDYFLTAYVKTANILDGNAYISVTSGDTVLKQYEIPVDEYNAIDGYTFVGVPFTVTDANTATTVTIGGSLYDGETLLIDNVMLSHTTGAAEYEMTTLGHFEGTMDALTVADAWKYSDGTAATVGTTSVGSFGKYLKINGGIDNKSEVGQVVYRATQADKNDLLTEGNFEVARYFTLSGWGRGSAQAHHVTSAFELLVEIQYYNMDDNPMETYRVLFEKDVTEWQFGSVSFATNPENGLVDTITVKAVYKNHPGVGWFDNISLVEDGSSGAFYEYDNSGYLSSYKTANDSVWYRYENGNLVWQRTLRGSVTEYTYDGVGNLVKQRNASYATATPSENGGLNLSRFMYLSQYQYSYNAQGLLVSSVVTDYLENPADVDNPQVGKEIISHYLYNTTAGSHIFGALLSEIDSLDNVTRYFYDETNGRLLATTYPDNTGVCYTYDAIGNMTMVRPATYSAAESDYVANDTSASVEYDYDAHNQLTAITTESTVYNFVYDIFGNSESISIGNNELVEYEYNANNGKLSVLYYGGKDENGAARGLAVKYVYDELDRTSEIWYNTGENGAFELAYAYEYNTAGALYSVTDYITDEVTVYQYDSRGKLMRSYVYDREEGTNRFVSSYTYDEESKLDKVTYRFEYAHSTGVADTKINLTYNYDDLGTLIGYNTSDVNAFRVSIQIDSNNIGHMIGKTQKIYVDSQEAYTNSLQYTYQTGSDEYSTHRISEMVSNVTLAGGTSLSSTTYKYTYDANGNITQIANANNVVQFRYEYDALGQLVREDNYPLERAYLYEYNNAGNITAKSVYELTENGLGTRISRDIFYYGNDQRGDQLTKVGTQIIEYDQIGNPVRIGTFDMTDEVWTEATDYEWHGRQLVRIQYMDCMADGTVSPSSDYISFTYNADGIRTSKNVSGVEHQYYLNGSQIIAETWTENGRTQLLIYAYDENGQPIGFKHRDNTDVEGVFDCYFFEKNLQGDIIAIYNEEGTKIGTYTYDAWGNHTVQTVSGNTAVENNIVNSYNPFRYRSYYYDVETSWYYLQSRYYNPEWCRFVNADGVANLGSRNTIGSYNLFTYCENNPIMYADPTGESWIAVVVLAALIVGVTVMFTSCHDNDDIPTTYEDVEAEEFDSAEDAVADFGNKYFDKSVEQDREYGVAIYQEERDGKVYYTYHTIFVGGVHTSDIMIDKNKTLVALAHMHGAETIGFIDYQFSDEDKKLAVKCKCPVYLFLPNGELYAYQPNGSTWSVPGWRKEGG